MLYGQLGNSKLIFTFSQQQNCLLTEVRKIQFFAGATNQEGSASDQLRLPDMFLGVKLSSGADMSEAVLSTQNKQISEVKQLIEALKNVSSECQIT